MNTVVAESGFMGIFIEVVDDYDTLDGWKILKNNSNSKPDGLGIWL